MFHRGQARSALNVGVSGTWCRRGRTVCRLRRCRQCLFKNELGQAARSLSQVRLQAGGTARRGNCWSRGAACGEAVIVVGCRSRRAAVVLWGGNDGGFLARSVAEDRLDIFVAALVGTPIRIAKFLVDRMDIELFDECLMRSLCSLSFWVRHCDIVEGVSKVQGGYCVYM